MEENLVKLKCIVCGEEFESNGITEEVKCPKCGRTFPFSRASKYYKSFEKLRTEERKVAEGEAYLKVDNLITEGEFFLENEEFEKAEQSFLQAVELTSVDYRVYMGLVKARTHNYTNFDDNSHYEYLQKAIEVCDYKTKDVIKKEYAPYYKKRNMSKEQLEEVTIKETDKKKVRVENLLKNGIPKHFSLEKSLKVLIILTPILFALFVGGFISFFLVKDEIVNTIVTFVAFLSLFVCAGLFLSFINNKKKTAIFNFVLDFYDTFNDYEFSLEETLDVLKAMETFAVSYVNGDTITNVEKRFTSLLETLDNLNNDKLALFMDKYKVVEKYRKEIEE